MWELRTLETFETLRESFAHRNGFSPAYVSHWDPLDDAAQVIGEHLGMPLTLDGIPYIYPNDGDEPAKVGVYLDYPGERKVVLTPTSTASTVVALSLAMHRGIRQLVLVQPFYFATVRVAEMFGLQPALWPSSRDADGYRLNELKGHEIGPDTAIWVTDPLYCTGHSMLDRSRSVIEACLQQDALVILDQSLSNPETSNAPGALLHDDRCWTIGSPHKGICVNGVKFSYLGVPAHLLEEARHYSDVLCGGASCSNALAVEQFLRGDVGRAWQAVRPLLCERKDWLSSQVDLWDRIGLDAVTSGHFVSCYVPGIDASSGQVDQLVSEILDRTGLLVIPGNRAYFPDAIGFNFRVNLLRLDRENKARLQAALEYLSGLS